MGAPDHPPAPPAVAEGDALDVTGSPPAAAAAEGWDAPGSAHRHPRRGGRGRPGRAGSPPPAPAAVAEGNAMDAAPDHTSTAPPGNGDALDLPDHTSTRTPRGGKGRPGRARITPAPAAAEGAKIGGYMPAYFTFFLKNQCIIFYHLMPLKFLPRTTIYFYLFCSRRRIGAMFQI